METKENRLTKTLMICLLVLTVLVSIIAALFLVDWRHVKFEINGSEIVHAEAGEPYIDAGAAAYTKGRLFKSLNTPLQLAVSDDVDTSVPGEYNVVYSVNYFLRNYRAVRRVVVSDTVAPTIELKHNAENEPDWFTGYVEEGFSAADSFDGDLTSAVTSEYKDGKLLYTVSDKAGNVGTAERELPGLIRPEFELNEGNYITRNASMYYADPGFEIKDSLGNDLSSHVTVSGEVYPYTPGEYEIQYSITNAVGDTVTASRIVNIVPVENPQTALPNQKTIYLTFDDGPGPYTAQLLDVLAKYKVKATFFVTNGFPNYQYLIAREAAEGHAVGVHSYTHEYYTIYASEEAYMEDFNYMEDIICKQTGSYTNLFRFPGGSSNTVSSFNPGIMTRLTRGMENMGYCFYDWNVASGDAGEVKTSEAVYKNVTEGCVGKQAAVVLQHDIKDFSVNAVENIILWGLNNGYVFRALDEGCYNAHHGVNN